MLNKFLFFILLTSCCFNLNGQTITLEKNNSLDKIKIKIPKNLILKYQTDSGLIKIKGNVLKYQFPYLTVLKKNDTLKIDVKSISLVRVHSNFTTSLLYTGSFVTSLLSFAFFMDAGQSGDVLVYLIASASFVKLTSYQFKSANKIYNTKTKWSFY
ncbi:MAG: hypothetical protein WCI53_07670 [Bacteroidota bacterium]|jgi:hypothetical protein